MPAQVATYVKSETQSMFGAGAWNWRLTWARGLRQNDVPTWVLQELGGWKSDTMVRRYAPMSVKHLAPYAGQLIIPATIAEVANAAEKLEGVGYKNGHSPKRPNLYLVT
ncbi:integrase [Novosphingobium sp. Rr 2-17]|nr:integrase [Novosphingobium sp. Rr 2-17]